MTVLGQMLVEDGIKKGMKKGMKKGRIVKILKA